MFQKTKQGAKILLAFFSGMLVFVGVVSAIASWPEPPNDGIFGGWLGQVFNLEESGTGNLVISSENVTLPNNVDIVENEQLTTKEYVDGYVDLKVKAMEGGVSGGGVYCYSGTDVSNLCRSMVLPGYRKFASSLNSCCFLAGEPEISGKRIFVTSVGYNGDLGGEVGADAKCQARADVAGLEGTFKAWLLDGTNAQKITDKFADTEYYNMQGQRVIKNFLAYDQTQTGFENLEAWINYDEFGRHTNYSVWTGLTQEGGVDSDSFCSRFKASVSEVGRTAYTTWVTDKRWFSYQSFSCAKLYSLICVET